ncbi:hypothetical protein CcCBS67573_g01106 [Chytriomyces confervae]|uniref:TLC domain-containing protein n=1 Tax=Chytriomyces confervae TaxID=246404 RepID=A0A507FQ93_9FUNG|nr:Ceramide synthase 3 [Chytriomyces hyalinus]TPX77628.1 hypothetical protein CcCBS67573_g01106 [Chytriomyces confervae]
MGLLTGDYIDWQLDPVMVFMWTCAWAVAHVVMYRLVIMPLADRCFVAPTALHQATAIAANSAKEVNKQDGKDARLKQRKNTAKQADSDPIQSTDDQTKHAAAVKTMASMKKKFAKAAWKCFVYSVSTLIGLYVLFSDTWWMHPALWMLDYPDPTSVEMKLYYMIGFGNYMYQTLSLRTSETDFAAMVVHHSSTIAVITASYIFGFTRVGIIILLLHDCSDPIMEYAKCSLYLKKQQRADSFFTLFAVVFIVTRNILFPYVIRCAHVHSILEDGTRMPRGSEFWGNFCLGCLWVLAALNFYWGFLIVKIAVKTAITGEVEGDIREQDDD